MNSTNHANLLAKRKKQFFLFAPLFMIPLMTLLFWCLGGGAGDAAAEVPGSTINGLNTRLPAAKLKDESKMTKLDYYRKADQDSAKRLTLIKNDPYYRLAKLAMLQPDSPKLGFPVQTSFKTGHPVKYSTAGRTVKDSDRNEVRVYRKLAALNATLNRTAPTVASLPRAGNSSPVELGPLQTATMPLHRPDTSVDPELNQLSKMVDKLVALQAAAHGDPKADASLSGTTAANPVSVLHLHPYRSDSLWGDSDTPAVKPDSATTLPVVRTAFYDLDPDNAEETTTPAISATVADAQTLVNGATLSMRLSQACSIGGVDLPTGQPIVGTVQLTGERMTVSIKSIRFENRIIPVSLSAYDLDGIGGVAIPDGIARQVAKQSADQSIESLGLTSVDQSIGAQAATAGIQAAKNLLSKKVRIISVTIPAGYEILLQDNQAKSH